MLGVLEDLKSSLPPVLYRSHPRFKELIGISPRTMANLDSLGVGAGAKKSGKADLWGTPRTP